MVFIRFRYLDVEMKIIGTIFFYKTLEETMFYYSIILKPRNYLIYMKESMFCIRFRNILLSL